MNQTLESVVKNDNFLETQLIQKINIGEYSPDMAIIPLWKANVDYAINSYFELHEFNFSKKYFNNCGLLDEFQIVEYNSRFLDYGLHHISLEGNKLKSICSFGLGGFSSSFTNRSSKSL